MGFRDRGVHSSLQHPVLVLSLVMIMMMMMVVAAVDGSDERNQLMKAREFH